MDFTRLIDGDARTDHAHARESACQKSPGCIGVRRRKKMAMVLRDTAKEEV